MKYKIETNQHKLLYSSESYIQKLLHKHKFIRNEKQSKRVTCVCVSLISYCGREVLTAVISHFGPLEKEFPEQRQETAMTPLAVMRRGACHTVWFGETVRAAHHTPLRLHQCAGVYRPHPPPPPIGGGVGPAPWFILPIRLRLGNPGGPLPSLKRADALVWPSLDRSGWTRLWKNKPTNSTTPQKRSLKNDSLHGDRVRLSRTSPETRRKTLYETVGLLSSNDTHNKEKLYVNKHGEIMNRTTVGYVHCSPGNVILNIH